MLGLGTAKMTNLGDEHFLLAEKLRQEDPDQFYILVRMHLSFVLDLNTDESDNNLEKKSKVVKWSLPFSKKQKLGSKTNYEGTVLNPDFIIQIQPIIEFLRKEENISQEGIFRRSGRVTRQQELKVLLQQGTDLNFNSGQYSVHECATVLKNILSELPESVLTDAHYPAYCQIAELYGVKNAANKERLLTSIQLLMLLLPPENKRFFQEIIQLLHTAVSHQDKNRMSAENLATLFTPHLLCPRKLSPEALHTNSQIMSSVLAFMIEKGSELFEIPSTVAIDVKAYWDKKEKKKLSPLKQMNESVCDGTAVNTVFTFVDRERTAQEHQANPTETALAQLYAYIQSLPESSKKRKLIKQFNKENGYGTPLTVAGKKRIKALNLGDSIKKHLSGLGKTTKRNAYHESAEEEEFPQSHESLPSLKKPPTIVADKALKENRNPHKKSSLQKNSTSNNSNNNPKTSNKSGTLFTSFEEDVPSRVVSLHKKKNKSYENLRSSGKISKNGLLYESKESLEKGQTSEYPLELPRKRSSSSPVIISPSKSPRVSDEHTMPVLTRQEHQTLTVSNKTLETSQSFNKLQLSRNMFGSVQNLSTKVTRVIKETEVFADESYKTPRRAMSDFNLCDTVPTVDVDKVFKTPVQKLNTFAFVQNTNSNGYFPSSNNTNKLPILCGPKNSFLMTTSTPASGNNCLLTPVVDKNNSMSPITKSTKRMPKAMQETMMTPRSRKPVISLSSTDLCNLANSDCIENEDSYNSKQAYHQGKRLILEDSRDESGNDSLSSTFRNYLFSRSVLTASPVDLSFSSRTDDFLSLSEQNFSEENVKYEEILNDAEFTESLLYCLDGNDPAASSVITDNSEKLSRSSCSFSDCDKNLHHVYETAL